MRIQLIILVSLLCNFAFAASDKEMAELFMNYDAVMLKHKVELVDDVFTEKFLKDNGGKKEFIEAVKELPKSEAKSLPLPKISWKKGVKEEMYFASLKELSTDKKKTAAKSDRQFIVKRENGRLKIDGTLSDAN